MRTLTANRIGTLPGVNLLPPEIEQERAFQRVQLGLGAGVLVSLGIVAALFVVTTGQVSAAKGDLSDSQLQTTRLQAQAAEYSEVPLVYSQVEAARAQLELAMGKEIRWSFLLNDLSLKTPRNVWLDTMTAKVNDDVATAAVAATAGPASYVQPGLGSVTFDGFAIAHNDVAVWLDRLAKQKGYDQAYFTEAARQDFEGNLVVKFKSQVSITQDALSKRYIQKAGS